MRNLPALLLVALLSSAQAAVLDDPSGDVETRAGGQPAPPSGLGGAIDLLSLDVLEEPEDLLFVIGVTEIDPDDAEELGIRITLAHGDRNYSIVINKDAGASVYRAYLAAQQAGQSFSTVVAELDLTVDDVYTVRVPRLLLTDSDGAVPTVGRSLTDVEVAAFATSLRIFGSDPNDPGVQVSDYMAGPDGPVDVAMAYGLEQSGHVELLSTQPFRTSNGAATTFVYDVQATNHADFEDIFTFDVLDAPDSWEVQVPFTSFLLGPGQTDTFPVIVQAPFAHQHGARTTFIAQMHSQSDPDAVGRVELGVLYPKIPQPAGHHDTLWFHSLEGAGLVGLTTELETLNEGRDTRTVYMNALEDDERSDQLPVAADGGDGSSRQGTGILTSDHSWEIRLDPTLSMGLAIDRNRTGHILVPVEVETPSLGAWIEGEVAWYGPDTNSGGFNDLADREKQVLFTFLSDVRDLPAGSPADFEATLDVVGPERIHHRPGSLLILHLGLHLDRPEFGTTNPDQAQLLPGGQMQLPLLEYEDPIHDLLTSDPRITLTAPTTERLANPGATVAHTVIVDSGLRDLEARVVGSNRDWASLEEIDQRTIQVIVDVPEDATDGDRADLVLEVASQADPTARALLRLVTTVDTDLDHPDDAGLRKSQDKGSPGPALAWLALALLAFVRRAQRS